MLQMVFIQLTKSWQSSPSKNYKSWQRFFKKDLILKTNIPEKTRGIQKIENSNSIGSSAFGYKNKLKQLIYVWKKCCEEKHWFIINRRRRRETKVSIHSYIIIFSIVKKKTFLFLLFASFQHRRKIKTSFKDCFKINEKQKIIMLKKPKMLNVKIMREI